MDEIPMPGILDPDRMVRSSRDDMSVHDKAGLSEDLEEALHQSCDYGQQLWRDLDAVRGYLLDSLPPVPAAGASGSVSNGASPTGPDDEAGWQNWMAAYAAVTSVLAGPHGDSGYGVSEARREARLRRSAATAAGDDGPFDARHSGDGPADERRARVERSAAENPDHNVPAGLEGEDHTRRPDGEDGPRSTAREVAGDAGSGEPASMVKAAGMAALLVLAARGLNDLLRPGHRRSKNSSRAAAKSATVLAASQGRKRLAPS